MKIVITIIFVSLIAPLNFAQTLIFAELTGSPTMNTAGWNLAGASYVGDTGGDADANPDELILTDNVGNSSGAIFFNEPIDLASCYEWNVQFDFRMADGTNADGIAFCFLDVPPTGYVSGGGVGIPSTANGVKVIFDSYDNGCGMNPEIQIMNGVGYTECDPNVIRLNNTSAGELNFLTDVTYKTAIINYSFGTLSVTVNGVQYLTGTYNLDFVGYLGFTASTGGSNDRHSIKNVTVFADVAPSDAGPDLTVCNGEPIQIGSVNNADYLYSWNASPNLSATDISNPTVSIENIGEVPISETFTVTTTLASNPNSCPTTDSVTIIVLPNTNSTIDTSICAGNNIIVENQTFNETGNYQIVVLNQYNCDSTIHLNLTVNPAIEHPLEATICEGEVFSFNNLELNQTGEYIAYLQNSTGCDSTVYLSLTVNPIETTNLNESICEGENFLFNGEVLSNSGLYSYIEQNSLGCDSIINLNLNVLENPPPPLINSNSPVECPGDILELSAIADQSALYFWSGPENFTSNNANVSIPLTLSNMGSYSLFVEVNGCPSEASSTIVSIANVNSFDSFDFPNIITPNGDDINDVLDIKSYFKTCQSFELFIFNRWGNNVFYQNENSENFSGNRSNGVPLNDGTYFYKLIYNNQIKSGNIQIVR